MAQPLRAADACRRARLTQTLDGTETMAEYLDPIIVSVAVMDRDRLEQTRAECLPLVRLLRNRFWRLWLRNRFAYVSVFGFYLLLVGGAIRLGIGNSHSLSIWSLLVAGAISLLITWFFISHTAYISSPLGKRREIHQERTRQTPVHAARYPAPASSTEHDDWTVNYDAYV